VHDLLRIGDLSAVELQDALALAAEMQADPWEHRGAYDGCSLACFLGAGATGDKLAFSTAARRVGLLPVLLDAEGARAGEASTFAAGLVVGSLAQRELRELARSETAPVINAGSDEEDPIQGLADLLVLDSHCGPLRHVRVAYVGAADTPVAHSLMEGGARVGLHLRIACPPEHAPVPEIAVATAALAEAHGGSVEMIDDIYDVIADVRAVYIAPPAGRELLRRMRAALILQPPSAPPLPKSLRREQVAGRLPAAQAALLTVLA
jgi:ornithine carbamoyltransferase